MNSQLKADNHKGRGFSTKIFAVFFVISILSLVYFNLIHEHDLFRVASQFPQFSEASRKAFVHSYKISISVALFFIDVILVGPFAFLSYFGDHIKPKRYNAFFNNVSLFDVGIALALAFTLNLASAHIIIIGSVSDIRLTIGEIYTIIGFNIAIDILWVIFWLIKIYTYSPEQRKELSKYAIR